MKKNQKVLYVALVLLLASLFSGALYAGDKVLAKVDVQDVMIHQMGVPVYAHPGGETVQDYILTIATLEELEQTGHYYQVLDTVTEGIEYALLSTWEEGARVALADTSNLLYDDGVNLLVKVTAAEKRALTEKGYQVTWIAEPIILPYSSGNIQAEQSYEQAAAYNVTYNAEVNALIKSITQTRTRDLLSGLSGETPITVGGQSYTLTTRNTYSGTPIAKATQYVYEFMQGTGLTVSYHNWNSTNKNVVAEKLGTTKKNEIVIVIGHLDNMPSSGRAPGADDNASGSIAVMLAAEKLSQLTLERTVRFICVTGEEQGLLGSKAYANQVKNAGENIVAVFNMDMIAWDGVGGPIADLIIRKPSNAGSAGDRTLATTVLNVDTTYNIANFDPEINESGTSASDHASFWNIGVTALCMIQDRSDFNPNYHTPNDNLSTVNIPFFTGCVQAAVGTISHLAGPTSGIVDPIIDLADQVPVSAISAAADEWKRYKITVPGNIADLKVTTSGGTGNADLYVRKDAYPDLLTYDSKSAAAGNNETCTLQNPQAGEYYIFLKAAQTFSGVTLVADYTEKTGGNILTPGVAATSSLSGTGMTEMWVIDVPAGTTNMQTVVTCPSSDFDVYGRPGAEPTTSVYTWRGYTSGGEDVQHANPVSGKWYIMVRSYSGSGSYSLTCTLTSGTTPQKPTITSFTLSSASIVEGSTTTLQWAASNADTVTASGTWTGSKAASGSTTVGAALTPGTYTYTLTASNSAGSVEKSVTLTVTPKIIGGYPDWQPYKSYTTGDGVTYAGKEYICIATHNSLPGWTPAAVPALWRLK